MLIEGLEVSPSILTCFLVNVGKPRRTTLLPSLALALIAAPLVTGVGCTGRAQRDLYSAKLNSEVRVLEDQLYAADYENRVLRDQLERYRREVAESKIATPKFIPPHDHPDALNSNHRRSVPAPIVDHSTDLPLIDMGQGLETETMPIERNIENVPAPTPTPMESKPFDPDSFDPDSFVDPGVPEDRASADGVPDDAATLQTPRANPDTKTPKLPARPNVSPPSFDTLPAPKTAPGRLPAPGGPVPPGKRDLEVPPLIPGDILPPDPNGGDGKPPGQIVLPDSIQAQSVGPDRLEVHETLSVGHYTDGKFDGAVIVVTAVDGDGRPMDMDQFDIDARMSMVVLDPTRKSSDALIGRWDFTREQVETMIRLQPVPGIHVPIEWKDEVPNSEQIIVHVRLEGEDAAQMNAQGELKLSNVKPITDWTPRAGNLR